MTQKKNIQGLLIAALFVVSLGGWLLHLRVHPPAPQGYGFVPFIVGLISIIVIPAMFCFRRVVQYAYVLNGFAVIIGTITMAHFALAHLVSPVTPESLILRTTFPDILMLLSKFFAGKAIFDLNRMSAPDAAHSGIFLRYPNLGWWLVHFIGASAVYAAGHFLWR